MRGIKPLLKEQGILVNDGGMALEIQKRGFDVTGDIWASNILNDKKGLKIMSDIHRDFLLAGADILIDGNYSSYVPKLMEYLNISEEKAEKLVVNATNLAINACKKFRKQSLVAASLGTFGKYFGGKREDAFHAKGNVYNVDVKKMMEVHQNRFEIMCDKTNADILAFETIRCFNEAEACLKLLRTRPGAKAWITFDCKNSTQLKSDENFADAVKLVLKHDKLRQVEAIGVNCVKPDLVGTLITTMKQTLPKNDDRAIIVYPNRGGDWNSKDQKMVASDKTVSGPERLAELCIEWIQKGANIVGGCCELGPEYIQKIREYVDDFQGGNKLNIPSLKMKTNTSTCSSSNSNTQKKNIVKAKTSLKKINKQSKVIKKQK